MNPDGNFDIADEDGDRDIRLQLQHIKEAPGGQNQKKQNQKQQKCLIHLEWAKANYRRQGRFWGRMESRYWCIAVQQDVSFDVRFLSM